MKHGLAWGLALVASATACGVVEAVEPSARPEARAPAPASTNPASTTRTEIRKPLDLRVGDVRKYMMPRDFQLAMKAPDADANTVVVEGQREVVPMRLVEDVPMGLGSLWYAAKDPKNAWRLLAPAVTFKDGPPVDKVPPPIFRWGP
jgi:hypothetical protein